MHIVVLGGAAGGGFPQWNCGCVNCIRARQGDPAAKPRTQCSLAVSADRTNWLLLNASPDLREQIAANPVLHPDGNGRDSPIRAVLLTGAEIDAVAGLLHLRESQPLRIYASARALALIAANPMFRALDPAFVAESEIPLGETETIRDFKGEPIGLTVEAYAVPGKVALYAEREDAPEFGSAPGDTLGVAVRDTATGACFHSYRPAPSFRPISPTG